MVVSCHGSSRKASCLRLLPVRDVFFCSEHFRFQGICAGGQILPLTDCVDPSIRDFRGTSPGCRSSGRRGRGLGCTRQVTYPVRPTLHSLAEKLWNSDLIGSYSQAPNLPDVVRPRASSGGNVGFGRGKRQSIRRVFILLGVVSEAAASMPLVRASNGSPS